MDHDAMLRRLLDPLYAAALEPARFPSVLARLAHTVDARSAAWNVRDLDDQEWNLAHVHGIPDEAVHSYNEHYWSVDAWRLGGERLGLTPGEAVPGHALIPDAGLRRTEFWDGYLRPIAMFHWCGLVVARWPRGEAVLSVQRAPDQHAFGEAERCFVERIGTHLARSLRVSRTLLEAERAESALREIADVAGPGLFLVGAGGRVLHANRAGERMLAARDGLVLHDARLHAMRASDDRTLARALGAVAATAAGTGSQGTAALSIPRPSGRRPLALLVVPVPRVSSRWRQHGTQVVVLVVDPDTRTPQPAELLRQWFGLTPAEARLAVRIAAGDSIADAAAALQLTIGSVRQCLKRLRHKTGARTHADLVRCLARLPAGSNPGATR